MIGITGSNDTLKRINIKLEREETGMCLAVAAKVVKMTDEFKAEVEVEGVAMNVSTALVPDVQEGDYVLVHAGFAIEIIDRVAAEENLRIWKEINEATV